MEAVLYFYAAGALIVYMLADHEVTRDELYAVGATSTLVARGFAYAYVVCQAVEPQSFTAAVNPEAGPELDGAAVPLVQRQARARLRVTRWSLVPTLSSRRAVPSCSLRVDHAPAEREEACPSEFATDG